MNFSNILSFTECNSKLKFVGFDPCIVPGETCVNL